MRHLLSVIKHDCRSTTGRNLRKLMLIQRKSNVEEITIDEMMKSTYMHADSNWRGMEILNIAKELCDVKNGHLDFDNLNKAEANTILENILTSF